MDPENHTLRMLKEIRDEIRGASDKSAVRFEKIDERFERMDGHFIRMDEHFKAIETTLKDLAEQMVMLSRGIDPE